MQLPAYIQNVAHAFLRQGKTKARAIQMAIGVVRNWAEGHDGHGNKVSAVVQAAAQRAIAEYNADRARAIATNNVAEWEAEIELAWNPDLHPRGGAGTAAGGKFVAKGSGTTQATGKQPPKKKGAKQAKPPTKVASGTHESQLRAHAAELRDQAATLSKEIRAARKSLLAQLRAQRSTRSTTNKAKAVAKKSRTATKKKAAVTKKKVTRTGGGKTAGAAGGAASAGSSGRASIASQRQHIAKLVKQRNGLIKRADALDKQANGTTPRKPLTKSYSRRDITASYLELTLEPHERSAPPETGADVGILGRHMRSDEMVESINGMSADRRAMMRGLRNSDAPPGYRWNARNRLVQLSEGADGPKVLAVF
jgi:hypothetical protein